MAASAWGKAWGAAWGKAWGEIAAPPPLPLPGRSAPIAELEWLLPAAIRDEEDEVLAIVMAFLRIRPWV